MTFAGCFGVADIHTDEDKARRPRLPQCLSWYELGSPSFGHPYALYQILAPLQDVRSSDVELVSAPLHSLLCSGMRYPPALAFARKAVRVGGKDVEVDRVSFLQGYERALREALEAQLDDGFTLMLTQRSDDFDILEGQYYWVRATEDDATVLVADARYYLTRRPRVWFRYP